MRRLAYVLAVAILGVAPLLFTGDSARAHVVPSPCDFVTGGGFVIDDQNAHANFGLVGGCKPNRFFGHVNFVDHGTQGVVVPSQGTLALGGLHLSSTSITGYFDACIGGCPSKYRDICGTANTNLYGTAKFRVRTFDPDGGGKGAGVDRFGIQINPDSGGVTGIQTRFLAGGSIVLHKPAPPGTIGPSVDELTGCPPPLTPTSLLQ